MAIELGESVGVHLDIWQQFSVRCILAEALNGRWAAFEAAVIVARQNGKGEILLVVELAGLFIFGEQLILHSAHEFKTAAEAFLRIKAVIDGSRDLSRKVKQIWTSHGSEGIELLSGQRLRFVARSKSSGRGFTGDRVILDEAQELPMKAMGALLPTLSARPNPQVVYAGTIPAPENDSEHLESVRDRAMAGDDPTLTYLGWTFDDADHADLDDQRVWAEQNPALGTRLTLEAIDRERRSLDDDTFARERLSIWPSTGGAGMIDADAWAALTDVESTRPSPVAFSVVVSPDRQWSSIGLAGGRTDTFHHVQIVQSGRGTSWVAPRLAELVAEWSPVAVAVDSASPAGSLLPDLKKQDIDPTLLGAREMGQACGLFLDNVNEATIRHSGQPVLAVAIGAAKKRRTGDTWVWAPKDTTTDISPLDAVTIALQALVAAPPPKKKRSGVVW